VEALGVDRVEVEVHEVPALEAEEALHQLAQLLATGADAHVAAWTR
jgi:hypothetical protein